MVHVPSEGDVVPWLRALFAIAALGCAGLVASAFVTARLPSPGAVVTVSGYAGLFAAFALRPEILSGAFVPRTASERGLRALFRVSLTLVVASLLWDVLIGSEA